jgi:4-amino-4-deoxy-L-arabinose transferase-like glycosyltransferase
MLELNSDARPDACLDARRSAGFFLIAAALFLTPRIGWMLAVDAAPMSDQLWYFERAVGLLNGEGYAVQGQPTAFWPVGYPAFLASLFAIFGPNVEVAKSANLILSAVAMAFVYRIARRATGSEGAARAALLLAVLYPTPVFYSELLYSELLFMALLLAGIDLLRSARAERSRWIAVAAAGVCFGLASLVKTQALLLPALLVSGALALRQIGFRRAVLTGLVAYAACLAVITPWTIRNWEVLGQPVLISTNGGFNLYMGNNPWNRWGSYMWPAPPEFTAATENLNILKGIPDEIGLNARLSRKAIAYIRNDPVEAALRVPYKLYQFFRFDPLPLAQAEIGAKRNGQNIHGLVTAVAPLAEVWHWSMMWSAFLFPVLFRLVRRPADAALEALLPIACFGLITAVFFGEPRFNLPLLPLYPVLTVCILDGFLRLVRWPILGLRRRA